MKKKDLHKLIRGFAIDYFEIHCLSKNPAIDWEDEIKYISDEVFGILQKETEKVKEIVNHNINNMLNDIACEILNNADPMGAIEGFRFAINNKVLLLTCKPKE